MIRSLLSFFIIVCLALSSCDSKPVKKDLAINDSIKKYLDLAADDSLQANKRIIYNDKALSFIDISKNDTVTRFHLSSLAFNYMRTKSEASFNKIAKIHFRKSVDAKDTLNLARYFRYKAAYHKSTFLRDSSFYYYLKAEEFYKKTNDELGLGIVYQNKGTVQYENYDYLGAELSSFKAYGIYRKLNNQERIYIILNQLGRIYNAYGEYNRARKYYNMALDIVNNSNMKKGDYYRAVLMSNLAFVSETEGKKEEAIKAYEAVLRNIKGIKKYFEVYSNTIDNLVGCKLAIKDYDNILPLLLESLKIRKEIGDPYYMGASLIHLSEYYRVKQNSILAEKYAKEALQVARNSKNKVDYLFALRQMVDVNKKYMDLYCFKYTAINDSIQVVERKSRNNFARIQLETDEIKQEKEEAIKQKWIIGSLSCFITLIVILLLIITRQRNKQKELRLLQAQQKANEDIYHLMLSQKEKENEARQAEKQRIARDLHDGVMNKLSSIRLNLSVLSKSTDEATIQKCLSQVENISQVETEIRSISHGLSQEAFNKEDSFGKMLETLVSGQNQIGSTRFELEDSHSIDWNNISSEIKMNLYRILQEACQNINKFAEAEKVVVTLIIDNGNICLSITDNGKGFDPGKAQGGIGLKNIKKRVEHLRGKITITSIQGKGTFLNIGVPLA